MSPENNGSNTRRTAASGDAEVSDYLETAEEKTGLRACSRETIPRPATKLSSLWTSAPSTAG